MAVAEVDVDQLLATARRSMFHLRDRRPDTYSIADPATINSASVTPTTPEPVVAGVPLEVTRA